MEPNAASETMPAPEAPGPRSFFSRFAGVYTSPRETFREIGRSPSVWVPLIVLLVISLGVAFYLTRTLDMEAVVAAQLEAAVQQGSLTQEQMEQQLAIASKFAGIQLLLMSVIGTLVVVFAIAGYAKLFSIFAGAENRFKPLLSVTTWSMLAVSIVQSALMVLVLQIKGAEDVSLTNINSLIASNLGAILTSLLGEDALPKMVISLAGMVDVFAIWTIALLAIGYSVVSKKLKTGTAAVWLAGGYVVVMGISIIASALFTRAGA